MAHTLVFIVLRHVPQPAQEFHLGGNPRLSSIPRMISGYGKRICCTLPATAR